MPEITPNQAIEALEAAKKAGPLPEDVQRRVDALATVQGIRDGAHGTLAGANAAGSSRPEAPAESPLVRFQAQYRALPRQNILDSDSTEKKVQARLSDPKNADKLKKVQNELQGGGRLYAIMEDGSLEFVDDKSETPPMFVKDNETDGLRVIDNGKEMQAARAQIEAKTHQWASIQEMLDWAKTNGFEVFEADTQDKRYFGALMKLAEAASPTGKFVGKSGGPWMATALKAARYAVFGAGGGYVSVGDPYPGYRDGYLGLLRRLRV